MKSMNGFFPFLFATLLITVIGAAIGAMYDIESILFTGPVLSVFGLAVSCLCYASGWRWGFLFGVSVPTVSVSCLSLILWNRWGPSQAAEPIGTMILAFAVGAVGLAATSALEVARGTPRRTRRKIQFPLAALLGLMFVAALPFGLYRMAGEPGLSIGIFLAYMSTAGYWIWSFFCSETSAGRPCKTVRTG